MPDAKVYRMDPKTMKELELLPEKMKEFKLDPKAMRELELLPGKTKEIKLDPKAMKELELLPGKMREFKFDPKTMQELRVRGSTAPLYTLESGNITKLIDSLNVQQRDKQEKQGYLRSY